MAKEPTAERTRSVAPASSDLRRALPAFPRGDLRLRLAEAARRLLDGASDDLASGSGPPLLAAVFAAGIAVYFALPHEPWLPALALAAFGLAALAFVRRHRGARALGAVVLAVATAGALAAAVSTRRVAAPRLDRERTVAVEGRVVDLDGTAKGGTRLGIAVERMEARGLDPAFVPTTITATLSARGPVPAIGDDVAFKARLKPPEGPVLPGGYDFARRAWFEGRGASGYVLGRTRPIESGPPALIDRVLAPIGALRHTVAERVRAGLPGGTGAIGAALMVGEQRAIPESVAEPLRASGLTHIVSISGLHMSLVAGGVMAALRLLFVAVPGFSLHHAAKKWAAVAAFVAASVYLMMSGMQVAALRSHLMVSVALLAVVVDRPAITMHTVAVAAMAILIVDPASALEPSFQMSFLAVIALVASWDLWRLRVEARPPPADDAGPITQGLVTAWRHVEGLAFSSLIAGLATAPVIAGVFYRGAPYSILANMVVLPVVGMLVMPAAVLTALAMPFGLEAWPLAAMGLGIDYMVTIGRWASSLPGGSGLIGAPHPWAMPLGVAAVLWLSLWRSRIRLFGIVPGLLSLALLWAGSHPDVLVGRHGSPIAVRGGDGRLHVLMEKTDRFDVSIWLAADDDARTLQDPTLREGWRCDGFGCAFERAPTPGADDGLVVAVVRDPRGFVDDCDRADVIVSHLAAPPGCAATALVIDRPRQAETGALALVLRPGREPPSAPPAGSAASPLTVPDPTTEAPPEPETTSAPAPSDATDTAPVRPRRRFETIASLPSPPRPWTPRDPLAERMAAEVRPEATADLTAEDDHPTDDGISSARDPATPPDLEP
jgi:competence protein ComEC